MTPQENADRIRDARADDCRTCGGTGELLAPATRDANGVAVREDKPCPACQGTGRRPTDG